MVSRAGLKKLIWGVTAIMFVVIGVLTLTPYAGELGPPVGDKVQHFIAFGALALPLAVVYPRQILWIFLAASAYGVLIEFLQPYVGRYYERGDIVADTIGAALGVAFGRLIGTQAVLGRLGVR